MTKETPRSQFGADGRSLAAAGDNSPPGPRARLCARINIRTSPSQLIARWARGREGTDATATIFAALLKEGFPGSRSAS